jgi:hypothetical protein
MPPGHLVLGYDRAGRCPLLGDAGCSIYEHRPRACRTYDCRVFPAADVDPDDGDGPEARQARRWRFDLVDAGDEAALAAVRAAARFVERHPEVLDDGLDGERSAAGRPAPSATRVAVLAVELAEAFLRREVVGGEVVGGGVVGGEVVDDEVVGGEVVDGVRLSPPAGAEPSVAEVRLALATRRQPATGGTGALS